MEQIGPKIENLSIFPEKCNVTLAQKIDQYKFKVKVWERGVGITKACGTAACATAVAANLENFNNTSTEILFSLGSLYINIDSNSFINMKGPVSDIKKININLR